MGILSIDNSQLTIDNSESQWYSLDGLKLSGKPTKTGVYIVKSNGVTKKIAVK